MPGLGMGLPVIISCDVRCVSLWVWVWYAFNACFAFRVLFTRSSIPCDWGWYTHPNLHLVLSMAMTCLRVFSTNGVPLSEPITVDMPSLGKTSLVRNFKPVSPILGSNRHRLYPSAKSVHCYQHVPLALDGVYHVNIGNRKMFKWTFWKWHLT